MPTKLLFILNYLSIYATYLCTVPKCFLFLAESAVQGTVVRFLCSCTLYSRSRFRPLNVNNLVIFPALFLIYFFYFYICIESSSLGTVLYCRNFPREGCREEESTPGLPYSTLARYQLSYAAP